MDTVDKKLKIWTIKYINLADMLQLFGASRATCREIYEYLNGNFTWGSGISEVQFNVNYLKYLLDTIMKDEKFNDLKDFRDALNTISGTIGVDLEGF
jgi:hypothetical protein